jgi:DNA-binding transcriptional LysR family regulator
MASLRALECLVAVDETGSVTRAAERLFMSQPALSHQIAALERELGTPVLERLPRGVRLTTAGRTAAAEARLALVAAQRAVAAGRAVGQGVEGRLRIGCETPLLYWLLVPILARWRRQRPGIALEVIDAADAADLLPRLLDGRFDVLLGSFDALAAPNAVELGQDPLFVVAPHGHRFRQQRSVLPCELSDTDFIHYQPTHSLARTVDNVVAAAGTQLKITVTASCATAAVKFAAAGLGVTVAPGAAVAAGPSCLFRPLDPRASRPVSIASARPADPLVARLTEELCASGLPPSPRPAHAPLDEMLPQLTPWVAAPTSAGL